MDIWSWVYDRIRDIAPKEPRLARLVHRISTATVDDQHEEVDAIAEEAVQLARAVDEPWLEIFVRHWRLQSLVFKRYNVREGLPEAVALIERAHRPDAIGCPQSICATQDLCAAYGYADDLGYAEERLTAARQTLSRIDPTWPCWRCISAELASVHNDLGQHAEALEVVEHHINEAVKIGEDLQRDEYRGALLDAYVGLGRLDEAFELNEGARGLGQGAHFKLDRRLDRAWLKAKMGRLEEAADHLPSWTDIEPTPSFYKNYVETLITLIEAEQLTLDEDIHGRLRAMAERLSVNEAAREALEMRLHGARACISQGWREVARAWVEEARAALPTLRADHGASAQVDAVAAEIEALECPAGLADRAALEALLEAQALTGVMPIEAYAQHPDESKLAERAARAWIQLGFEARGLATLTAHLEREPEAADVFFYLGALQLEAGQAADVLARLEAHPDLRQAPWALFLEARARHQAGDLERALEVLEVQLDSDAPHPEAPRMRLDWLMALNRHAEALTHASALIEAGVEEDGIDWRRIQLATRLGDWAAARDSAARLGFKLKGEAGPIRERWGICKIDYGDGHPPAFARRTGPVTAAIFGIDPVGRPQRHGDEVIFTPTPLDTDEGSGLHTFPRDLTLEAGGYATYTYEGRWPGEEALTSLAFGLKRAGFGVEEEEIEIDDRATEEIIHGFCLLIACPEGQEEALVERVEAFSAGREGPHLYHALRDAVAERGRG